MTPHEWWTTDDFPAMLIYLRGRVPEGGEGRPTAGLHSRAGTLVPGPAEHTTSGRLRAFAAACLPRWRELPLDPFSRVAVDAYETFLNGTGTRDTFRAACLALQDAPANAPQPVLYSLAFITFWDDTPYGVGQMTWNLTTMYAGHVAREQIAELERDATEDDRFAWGFFGYNEIPLWRETADNLNRSFPPLLRETVGDPFRPIPCDAPWRSATAVSLARHVNRSGDFTLLPILADALQDAGCEEEAILGHCRDPRQVHVRGCWVVDLVLGKS
jgi:hypothetical protein